MDRARRDRPIQCARRSRHRVRKQPARERVAPRVGQGGGARLKNGVERAFAPDGPLATAVDGFKPRPQQLEMAQAIHQAIEGTSVLVAEAGTGTGKTFAYLVPALLAGGKVIVSTGTKTLQDQLFDRDLPTVRKALAAGAS